MPRSPSRQGVLFALAAILLWASLATLGVSLRHVPPFLLTGLGLLVGSLVALPLSRGRWSDWKVPLPTLRERQKILEVHARKKPLAPEVSLALLAAETALFSGAKLESLLNEAAICAAKRDAEEIARQDVDEALNRMLFGMERPNDGEQKAERELTAAHEAGHARGGNHGGPPDAEAFGNGAVADVRVGICLAVAGKEQPLRGIHRRGKPAVAEAADADAEHLAVAGHGGDHRACFNFCGGIHGGFTVGHCQVEEELIGDAEELQHFTGLRFISFLSGDARGKGTHQQRRGGDVALVELVAHGDGLRHQRRQVKALFEGA